MSRPVASLSRLFILGALGLLAGSAAAVEPQAASTGADSARIRKARNAMRPLGREARIGPWRLLTDAAMGELTHMDAVAERLAVTYTARYGLSAAPGPGQVVVIYSSNERYRRFVEADGGPFFAARGHAGAGLAVFSLGPNPLDSRALLVHELTHLLSQGAFGDSLPAWLDEGIAEDLAWCRVDGSGRLQPDTLDAHEETRGGGAAVASERSGSRVTVDAWLERARAGRVPPLAVLLTPGSRLFIDPGARRDASTQSAMLVRWCLAEPARAEMFKEFLRGVSLQGSADARALAASLGLDEATLSKRFFEWVTKGVAF